MKSLLFICICTFGVAIKSCYSSGNGTSILPSTKQIPSSTKQISPISTSRDIPPQSSSKKIHTSKHLVKTSTPAVTSVVPSKGPSSKFSPMPSSSSQSPATSSPVPSPTNPPTTVQPKEPIVELNVTDKSGNVCLSVIGHIIVQVDNLDTITFTQENVKVSGRCLDKSNTSFVVASLTSNDNQTAYAKMTFTFGKDIWYMSSLKVSEQYNKTVKFSGKADYDMKSNNQLYQAPKNHGYKCAPTKEVVLKGDDKHKIRVTFDKLYIQPFSSNGTVTAVNCPAKTDPPTPSSVVPIAVGCALAGLIVIVLIAYLIGRRKNSRGYQKV